MERFSVSGQLRAGNVPVKGAQILLVEAGTTNRSARVVARTSTRKNGHYDLHDQATTRNRLLYTLAFLPGGKGGSQPGRVLAGVLAPQKGTTQTLNINELTTVATAWSFNNFLEGNQVEGPKRSLKVAQAAYNNLVTQEGSLAERISLRAAQETKATFFSLANILSRSVTGNKRALNQFLDTAVDARGTPASSTLEALSNLATAPLNVNRKLFQRSQRNPTYSGGLATKPDAWVLPLVHFGRDKNGVKPLNGPGNIAIDKQGNLWISNNYTPFAPQGKPPFPGNTLINLDPGGNLIQDTPLQGGGLYGAGYGIGIDPDGQIWVGNYGFGGRNAFTGQPALIPLRGNGNSVSRFGPQGQVRSPNGSKVPQRVPTGGITRGRMLGPQGIVADQQGNIWIASNRETRTQDSKVVLYLDGLPKNPSNPRPFKHPSLSQPFDIAIDAEGDAWVAYTEGGRFNNGGVVELRYNERTQRFASRTYTDRRFNGPWGIATAKNGEVWFTNNGRRNGSSVSVINPQRNTKETFNLSADKLGAWGINLDTRGNVYLTAFRQQSIYVLSGTRQRVAGQVVKRGELLSPSDGYRIPGILQRATGVELDPAGNLWVANNYQTNPQNFGGRNIIQYVGVGSPVDTPLIGPVASVGPGSKTPPGRRTLFSLANPEILGRTRVRPEDIAVYNRSSGQYGLFFDGSRSGLKGVGIDGFDVLTGNRILLSFTRKVTVGGSTFQPSDLVLYSTDNLDSRSKGSYQMILDGSDVGLKRRGENITGVSQDPLTGDFLITVSGSFSAQGVTASSRDIVRFQPDRLGNRTRGSWKLETTGDDLGLARNSRGLDALSEVNESQLISTRDSEPLPGLSGNRSDIIKITPSDGASNKGSTFTKSFGRLDRNNVIGIDIL